MAKRNRVTYGKNGGFGNIADDVKTSVIKAARIAIVRVLNELSDEGPGWSGEFRDSWYVESRIGKAARIGGEEGIYTLFNVPGISQTRDARGRFQKGSFSGSQLTFSIGNSAPHAEEAMDLIPGIFADPGIDPIKPVTRGQRYGNLRGNVAAGERDNRITAPLDWYTTYMAGGRFSRDFRKGVRLGFRNAPRSI